MYTCITVTGRPSYGDIAKLNCLVFRRHCRYESAGSAAVVATCSHLGRLLYSPPQLHVLLHIAFHLVSFLPLFPRTDKSDNVLRKCSFSRLQTWLHKRSLAKNCPRITVLHRNSSMSIKIIFTHRRYYILFYPTCFFKMVLIRGHYLFCD